MSASGKCSLVFEFLVCDDSIAKVAFVTEENSSFLLHFSILQIVISHRRQK